MRLYGLGPGRLTWSDGVNRMCLSLFLTIILLVLHRHFWLGKFIDLVVSIKLTQAQDVHDPHKCDALLTRGQLLDRSIDEKHVDPSYRDWQPSDCMMHKYRTKDVSLCLSSRRIVFVGDSTIRQIFWATAKKLGVTQHQKEQHTSFSFTNHGVTIEFIWDPFLNSSYLQREVTAAAISEINGSAVNSTALLIIGGGLWHARHLGDASLQHYKDSIGHITQILDVQNTDIQPKPGAVVPAFNVANNLVVLTPVPTPLYEDLAPMRTAITPAKIDSMNKHLRGLSSQRILVAWAFALMSTSKSAYREGGLHFKENVANSMADALLNRRCNIVLRRASPKRYPMDKTCCNVYREPNRTQSLLLNLSTWFLPCLVLISHRGMAHDLVTLMSKLD